MENQFDTLARSGWTREDLAAIGVRVDLNGELHRQPDQLERDPGHYRER
jgi:hypothetical protein